MASSEANTTAWSQASTFTKGTDIYVGVKVSDPDKDIVKVGYSVKLNGNAVEGLTSEIACPISVATFTGNAITFQFSQLTDGEKNATVADGYSVEVYVIDSKGNKSATKTSNTFNITS